MNASVTGSRKGTRTTNPVGEATVYLVILCILVSSTADQTAGQSQSTSDSTLRTLADQRGIAIGTAVSGRALADPAYAGILASEFNEVEPENEMKLALVHPRPDSDPHPYNFAPADELVSFAASHNMRVRGHTLVWHNQVADWVKRENLAPPQLSNLLENHIRRVVQHFGNKIYAWDVVNEAFNEDGTVRSTLWYDQPGIGFKGRGTRYVEQAFRWARAADSSVELFYNDYNTETINPKSDAIYAMAKDFLHRGVPLDGIGFQLHVDLGFDDAAKLASFKNNLRRFADLGLEIHITELDIRLESGAREQLEAQAALYGKIVRTCLENRACKVVQTWGFTDKHSWIPAFYSGYGWALPWDSNYTKKPAYAAIHEALVAP